MAVLDRLGGHPAGDIASALAADVMARKSSEVETEQENVVVLTNDPVDIEVELATLISGEWT